MKNNEGMTPFHFVCQHTGMYERPWQTVLQLFLTRGVNIDEPMKCGWTALHFAADGAQPEKTQLLLSNGANACLKNNVGETPLALCFPPVDDCIHVAQLLLDYGAYITSPTAAVVQVERKYSLNNMYVLSEEHLLTLVLNWYLYQVLTQSVERKLTGFVISILNDALSQMMAKVSTLQHGGIIASVVSVIHDFVHRQNISILNDMD
jgi:hypothetical protein